MPTTIKKIISESVSCECNPYIAEYEWRNEMVYLYTCNGPACDCIPAYYDSNGNTINMNSGYTFENFIDESMLVKTIWQCGK